MNSKQKKTLRRIFEKPTRADVTWTETRSLLAALGCRIWEGDGSRVRAMLNDTYVRFHKPHPQKELKKYAVEAVRDFLKNSGVTP